MYEGGRTFCTHLACTIYSSQQHPTLLRGGIPPSNRAQSQSARGGKRHVQGDSFLGPVFISPSFAATLIITSTPPPPPLIHVRLPRGDAPDPVPRKQQSRRCCDIRRISCPRVTSSLRYYIVLRPISVTLPLRPSDTQHSTERHQLHN